MTSDLDICHVVSTQYRVKCEDQGHWSKFTNTRLKMANLLKRESENGKIG